MWLTTKRIILLLLLIGLCQADARAGLFGISRKDRLEYQHARDAVSRGEYQQAITDLTQYIYKTKNVKRREVRAYRLLGICYEHFGMLAKALETYLEALEFHPKDTTLLLAAANLYKNTKLTDRSIELYERVLAQDPNNSEALAGLAENYINMGFYSKAQHYYQHFFKLNPQAPYVHRARYAYSFLQQRDFKNAFINITMAKMENSIQPDIWRTSAKAYKGLGKIDDALKDLDVALLLAPNRADLIAEKALWLYQQGDYQQSMELADKLLVLNADSEIAFFIKFLNLNRQKKTAAARRELRRITALKSDSFIYKTADKILSDRKEPSKTTEDVSVI